MSSRSSLSLSSPPPPPDEAVALSELIPSSVLAARRVVDDCAAAPMSVSSGSPNESSELPLSASILRAAASNQSGISNPPVGARDSDEPVRTSSAVDGAVALACGAGAVLTNAGVATGRPTKDDDTECAGATGATVGATSAWRAQP